MVSSAVPVLRAFGATSRHGMRTTASARLPAFVRALSLSEAQPSSSSSFDASIPPPAHATPVTEPQESAPARRTYAIPRNNNGVLPVYTNLRHEKQKVEIQIRNVEGNATQLARDIKRSLFAQGSPEASRLTVQVVRNRHLVLHGGPTRWKHRVVEWILKQGL